MLLSLLSIIRFSLNFIKSRYILSMLNVKFEAHIIWGITWLNERLLVFPRRALFHGVCYLFNYWNFLSLIIHFIPVPFTPVHPIIPVLTFQGELNITSYVYKKQFYLTVKPFHDYKPSNSNISWKSHLNLVSVAKLRLKS